MRVSVFDISRTTYLLVCALVTIETAHRGLRVLFVCSGNTCRSPMAAAFVRERYAGIVADSAGAHWAAPAPCTEAARLLFPSGQLDDHVSKSIDAVGGESFDHVWLLHRGEHLQRALEVFPEACVASIGADVDDPYGDSQEAYRACLSTIEGLIVDRLGEHTRPPLTRHG